MLNLMDKNSEKNIMSRVEEKDPELAEKLENLCLFFEDLVFVDDKGIQTLLKEVDNQKLVIALKTSPEEVKEKLSKHVKSCSRIIDGRFRGIRSYKVIRCRKSSV